MAAITTPLSTQRSIVKFYSDGLKRKNNKPIISNRGGPHLRINYSGNVLQLLNSILPCTLKGTDVSISGSYPTQELTIQKNIDGAKKGDKIYFVLAVSTKGVLKTKQLTPDSLGFGGQKINKDSFLRKTKDIINKSDVPENIKGMLHELAIESNKSIIKISDKYIGTISDPDIKIIAKDFGEISGAIWFMNQFNKNVDAISYPTESNAALVDYYAHVGKRKIAISAKADEGAPPSINAMADILRPLSYTNKEKESARKAIISISDNSTVEGIVDASMNLHHRGYIWLKKNFFDNKNFTAADCEKVLEHYKSHSSCLKDLQPFYEIIGRSASEMIAKRIFDIKAKRYGLIISPLGYSLVDTLNKNNTYLDVLNDAANSLVVSQIYIIINKSQRSVNYIVKEFSASSFKFEYNANAGIPSLKKISFKMNKHDTKITK